MECGGNYEMLIWSKILSVVMKLLTVLSVHKRCGQLLFWHVPVKRQLLLLFRARGVCFNSVLLATLMSCLVTPGAIVSYKVVHLDLLIIEVRPWGVVFESLDYKYSLILTGRGLTSARAGRCPAALCPSSAMRSLCCDLMNNKWTMELSYTSCSFLLHLFNLL